MVCKFNKFTCHFLMDYKEDKFMENLIFFIELDTL